MEKKQKIGFIGVGSIGFPILKNLIRKGYKVNFYARKPEVISQAKDFGAKYISKIEDLNFCDIIAIFVNTDEQCVECVQKLLFSMKRGIVVIGSTIAPKTMLKIVEQCKKCGVDAIEAPVTGGIKGAELATLTIITSGEETVIAKCRRIFLSYGSTIIVAGNKVGEGLMLKALIQLLVGINAVAMSEVFSLGLKCGLDAKIIYDTVTKSAGNTRIFENRGLSVINRDFTKKGTIGIMNKDLGICQELAIEKGAPFFLGEIAKKIYQEEESERGQFDDLNAVVRVYEKLAGIQEKDYDKRG